MDSDINRINSVSATDLLAMPEAKQRLLLAAEELFDEKGYDATSVRELAKRSNTNLAMISYYFGSKEALFENLVECKGEYLSSRLAELTKLKASPQEKISFLVGLYVDRIMDNHKFHRILMRELSLDAKHQAGAILHKKITRNMGHFQQIINEGIELGVFKPVNAQLLMLLLVGTISLYVNGNKMTRSLFADDNTETDLHSEQYRNLIKDFLTQVILGHLTK